jgi:N-acetylmuramoyl-L-alanine amidase
MLAALVTPNTAYAATLASTATASFWYAGTRLAFERPQLRDGALAVASDDLGLGRFLNRLGATLAYRPGRSDVLVTGGDKRTVVFRIGDVHYSVDGVTQVAPFAPYVSGGIAYVPFLDLSHALSVDPIDDDTTTVLQPQISALDVRAESRVTIVTFRGASQLHFKRLSDAADEKVSLAFLGTASTLDHDRAVTGPGLRNVSVIAGGTPKNPTTVINFEVPPGGTHVLVPTDSPNTIAIAFAPPGVALGGTAIPADGGPTIATMPLVVREMRVAAAASRGSTAPITPTALTLAVANVTNFETAEAGDSLGIRLAIVGDVTYEWHRLSDNRWYVDLKPATLAIEPQEQSLQNSAVVSLRIKSFVGPLDKLPTVRVAVTLTSPRAVTIVPEPGGMTLAVDRLDDLSATRTGAGELSLGRLIASIVPLPPPPPAPDETPAPDPSWKFAPTPQVASNGKLIVIDPGHGGSDSGAAHNGLAEAMLNLDVSKRLRSLLVARGWQVKFTRDGDSDVYGVNASAHDELQARDDVANEANARMFISIHTNSFTSSSLNGTTTYYFNPDSYALASAVHARLAAALPTKDDGIRKENFYVIHHAKMPSILIETAFLSNLADAALLKSESFLQSVAVSIADGVRDFATSQSTVSSHGATVDGQ